MKNRNLLYVGLAAVLMSAAVPAISGAEFRLIGGHFYGPGPIVPDSALPDGKLVNVEFDRRTFRGQTGFANDGSKSKKAVFSDGKTRINQNIDAGVITLGDGTDSVLLAAVDGGPHKGSEVYYLDGSYNMIWRVDLALDPGFEQGIIRVDDFKLTTGIVQIQPSIQTQKGYPEGYDQAGSLKSGQYLAGRLGDFDGDGYLDGAVVAGPNVPLASNLLPGAPVGNHRGFKTDVQIPPHLAAELTLRSIANFRGPVEETMKRGDLAELGRLLQDIEERLLASRENMERSLMKGAWNDRALRQAGHDMTWRVDALMILNFIPQAWLEGYKNPAGKPSFGTRDSARRFFNQLDQLIVRVSELNKKTGDTLPAPEALGEPSARRMS